MVDRKTTKTTAIPNFVFHLFQYQRRTGKSYLLRQIAAHLIQNGIPSNNIFFLNKEFIEFDEIQDYKELDALIKYYKKTRHL